MASSLVNRQVPSVLTQIVNRVAYSALPDSETIAYVGPASGGALNQVLTYSNAVSALADLGACRLTNQMFASWAGGAGTIKVVRIGGTKAINDFVYSVVSLDNYAANDYLKNRYSYLSDLYAAEAGITTAYQIGTKPSQLDSTLSGNFDNFPVILLFSDEKIDTLDVEFTTAATGLFDIAYYNGDASYNFNDYTGFAEIPQIEVNGSSYSGGYPLDGISGDATNPGMLSVAWDLDDIPDWQQTTIIVDEVEYSGFALAIRRKFRKTTTSGSSVVSQTVLLNGTNGTPEVPTATEVGVTADDIGTKVLFIVESADAVTAVNTATSGTPTVALHDTILVPVGAGPALTWASGTKVTPTNPTYKEVQRTSTIAPTPTVAIVQELYKFTTTWSISTAPAWDIRRIAERIGGEPAWAVYNQATLDGSGVITGEDPAGVPTLLVESKYANDDAVTVTFRRLGNRTIEVTFGKVDSAGVTTNESYRYSAVYNSDTSQYEYTDLKTELIDYINETSDIVTLTLLETAGADIVWGWGYDDPDQADVTELFSEELAGGANHPASVTTQDYLKGLQKLSKEADVYFVLPCIPEDVIYKAGSSSIIDNDKFNGIMDVFAGEITRVSEGVNMKPRMLLYWLSPAYQNVGTIANENLNIKAGSVRRLPSNSRYTYLVQKLGFAELEASGSSAYRREYLASHVAGLLAARRPADSLTRKSIAAGRINETYDFDELDVLIRNGVLSFTQIVGNDGVVCAKAINTAPSTEGILKAISARRIADKLAVESTAILEEFIGRAMEEGIEDTIRRRIGGYLGGKIGRAVAGGLINGFQNIVVLRDDTNPNKIHVSYDLFIITDLDYIDQTLYLNNAPSTTNTVVAVL